MPEDPFPVLWSGSVAVVRTPPDVDITNADQLREALLSVLNLGATAVVVDMTRAAFCDSAGVAALVRAQRRASASEARLSVATSSATVLRLFDLIGLSAVVDVHPDVATALRAGSPLCRLPGDPGQARPPGRDGEARPPSR